MKKKTRIFIDNMMWDDFFAYNIDLEAEFPCDEFDLFITGEAHSEISMMPEAVQSNTRKAIDLEFVETDQYFGFGDLNNPSFGAHLGGFGDLNDSKVGGRFIAPEEARLIDEESKIIGPKRRRSGLLNNEADVSIGARSLVGIVLTKDRKGVLKRIPNQYGGRIIDMNDFDGSIPLRNYVQSRL